MDDVSEAALFNFRPYHPHSNIPSQPYYIQSPSSPHRDYSPAQNSIPEPSRFSLSILSRYSSSSRSTTNSEKPTTVHFKSRNSAAVADVDDDEEEHEGSGIITVREMLVKNEYEEDDDDQERIMKKRGGCFGFLRIGRNSSNAWICLQIGLRLVVSLGFAFLVFYIATKPPRPTVSIQMGGISEFELGEGVDRSGIPTKILSCNSSIHMLVENKSKVFGLQLHRPLIALNFDRLLLTVSHSSKEEMNVDTYETGLFKMTVGTKHKPMYGAGRSMQDMLESGKGLPLLFKLTVKSSFHVLGSLINPEFHHKATCHVFLLSSRHYNNKNHTHSFNSTCTILTSSS
ncbi:unnamed protein product [Rhodiola kirilowii]